MGDILHWISDDDLLGAINTLRKSVGAAVDQASTRRQKNVVDPISVLTFSSAFGMSSPEGLKHLMNIGSSISGMSNAHGHFHQTILGSVPGWSNHDAGYDLENPVKCILAEVKNKHNTMNATNREKVISELDTAVKQKGPGNWTGYLVPVIPSKPVRYKKPIGSSLSRPIYETDGASFYHTVTEDKNAIHDLLEALLEEYDPPPGGIWEYFLEVINSSIPPRL